MNCKICLKKIISVQKHKDYHNSCLTELFGSLSISPHLAFNREIFKPELSVKYIQGMSISGVQKKLSLHIQNHQLALVGSGGKYILKPTVEEFPELSENEHLSMLIGKLLDIETPPLGLVSFEDGELAYIIKRFDWRGENKIHKEDMASIFDLARDKEETYKYSQSYEQVGQKLDQVAGHRKAVLLDFFNRIVFNFLIHNGDYHLKNISVVSEKLGVDGIYDGLSPNYDSMMTRFYFKDEPELALDLLAGHREPKAYKSVGFYTKPDLIELGTSLGLPIPAMQLIFDKIKKKKKEIFELIARSYLSSKRKTAFKQNLQQRLIRLEIEGS